MPRARVSAAQFWPRAYRALLLVLIVLLAAVGLASAHSFYPLECCSERDCFPIEARDVREVRGGWQLQDGTFIAYREARPSPDGKFHVCRHNDGKGSLIRLHEKPACFWAPVSGS